MAIIADIVHRSVVYRDIYISPHSINTDSFYTLKYLVGGKHGSSLLGMEETMRSFTFNNSRAGLSKPDGTGIAYDRTVGAWQQVYADLKAKIAAGVVPWITNVRDEDETAAEPAPKPENIFADLILADETLDEARERLSQRLRELRHYLIAPEIKPNEDGSVGLTPAEQAELADLERRQTLGRWLDA